MSRNVAHWLVGVAQRAGLPGAKDLEVDGSIPLLEAWTQVAAHCGISALKLAQEVSDAFRLPLANLEVADAHAQKLLPEKLARRVHVVPLRQTDRQFALATADPMNEDTERDIGFATGRLPIFEIADPLSIQQALDDRYASEPMFDRLLGDQQEALDAVQVVQEHAPDPLEAEDADSAPVIRLSNVILRDAFLERASDIHLEPGPGGGTVRLRVDGVMRTHMRMPLQAFNRVVSRLKIMGKLDIADRLRPQDGRARVQIEGKFLDLRISTVPARESEKMVLRLLRQDTSQSLDELSMLPSDLKAFRALLASRNGIVIVTGPTGSGKTTTLYAALRELATGEVNISTVEDPIEYELPGITQMQVETKRDFTFATALRAILRQDPDIILVGEIRDLETARIAVQASMTGHLVLATLHTNDAVSSIARLLDIGIDSPSIAATLRGVLAQRLMRRVCKHCVAPADLNDPETARLAKVYATQPKVQAVGCAKCGKSGYSGRASIVEVFTVTPPMAALVAKGTPTVELQRAAAASGLKLMHQAALQRVTDGETTLQEVVRVIGEPGEEVAPAEAEAAPASDLPRILVVDDDPVCRKVAKSLLQKDGFAVTEAESGEKALELLEAGEEAALVVLDLNMPGIPGDEVLKRLRASTATAALPVVVLTGTEDEERELALMDAGADDYIRKPIEPRRFLSRIKATLRRTSVLAA